MTSELTKQQRVARIVRIGKLLYGDKYQSPLARVTGIPQSTIAHVVTGTRQPSDDLERRLHSALIVERRRGIVQQREMIKEEAKLALELGIDTAADPVAAADAERTDTLIALRDAIEGLHDLGMSRLQIKEYTLAIARAVAEKRYPAPAPESEPEPEIEPSGPAYGM